MKTNIRILRRCAVLAAAVLFTSIALARVDKEEIVTSCTWLQNVGTDHFTVMCETKSILGGLQLQYWPQGEEGKAKTCAFLYRPLAKLGKHIAVAKVTVKKSEGKVFDYRILSWGEPVEKDGTQGSVRLWKSGSADGDFTAVVWGDNQSGIGACDWAIDPFATIHGAFNHMMTLSPDFGLSTGDMAGGGNYAAELRPLLLECTNPILGHFIPYYVAWGNHDRIFFKGLQNRMLFSTGEDPDYALAIADNYHFYRGDVLFIFIDHFCTETLLGRTKAKAWLKDILSTSKAKKAKFKIALQHAPVYLETWHDEHTADAFRDVYNKYGVDLVLSGHMHGCERIECAGDSFIQLTNGGLGYLDHNEKVEENYGDATKIGGHRDIPYLWSRQKFEGSDELGDPEPVKMGCISSYSEISVKGDKLTFTFHGFNADGSYIGAFDRFTLTARANGTTGPLEHTYPETEIPEDAKTPAELEISYALADGEVADGPVTRQEWYLFESQALGRDVSAPSEAEKNEPATGMSRREAEAFCRWLGAGYCLPTVDNLSGASFNGVAEWTSDDDDAKGWCRIANCKVSYISTPSCTANYLGFRVAYKEVTTLMREEMMAEADSELLTSTELKKAQADAKGLAFSIEAPEGHVVLKVGSKGKVKFSGTWNGRKLKGRAKMIFARKLCKITFIGKGKTSDVNFALGLFADGEAYVDGIADALVFGQK